MGSAVIDGAGLRHLVQTLTERGYQVVGPKLSGEAITLGKLASADDLPRGWGVQVAPGHYRLRRRDDEAVFGHSAGPQSWKQFLHPPRQKLWSSDESAAADDAPRYAFIGVRACDLSAISILIGVLGAGAYPEQGFVNRVKRLFIVAVNCTEPGGLCFCASMDAGPQVVQGFDLALTERIVGGDCSYLVDVGSDEGADVLSALPHRKAEQSEIDAARDEVDQAAQHMGRQMPDGDLRNLLVESRESPHWEDVASRCLRCGNCTMVCPTCFCTTTEDVTDLTGQHAQRWLNWASCFEIDFTYIHGGSVRQSGESRYRHWITHKLSTWHDQFGSTGCVGCGRCIAWCPTGIDITEELNTLAGQSDDRWQPRPTPGAGHD